MLILDKVFEVFSHDKSLENLNVKSRPDEDLKNFLPKYNFQIYKSILQEKKIGSRLLEEKFPMRSKWKPRRRVQDFQIDKKKQEFSKIEILTKKFKNIIFEVTSGQIKVQTFI